MKVILKKKKRILVKIIKIGKFDWNGIKFCNDTLDEFCGQKKLKMLMKSTFGGSY